MTEKIWLTGSKEYTRRAIRKHDGKAWIVWYGKEIEVVRSPNGCTYRTVESY